MGCNEFPQYEMELADLILFQTHLLSMDLGILLLKLSDVYNLSQSWQYCLDSLAFLLPTSLYSLIS